MTCPDEEAFVEFVEHRLEPGSRADFHRHVDACHGCRRLLASLADQRAPPAGRPGQRLGRYLLERRLGHGGMGVVWRALDTSIGRVVALKFLSPHLVGDERAAQRLKREARAASALDHPNVGQVYDVDELDGAVFLTMPLYEGETLQERLARGKLPPREAALLLRQMAEGLGAAHAAGIVHRDVKPSNVILGKDGRVRVLDFGLAKMNEPDGGITSSGHVLGTIAYMPPEQHSAAGVDARADVWALGVTGYELLSGAPPFGGANALAVIEAATTRDAAPLAGAPPDLATILFKCLEKDPARRYPTARELARELDRFLGDEPIEARPAGAMSRLGRRARRHRAILAVAAIGVIGMAALAIAVVRGRLDAAARVARADRLGQTIQRMRSTMRGAYLLPLHDTRPEREEARAQLRELEAELARGDGAGGLVEYALGWGYLALRDFGAARPHLEAAQAAGQRSPDLAWALAIDLATLYQRERAVAAREPDATRTTRLAALEKTWRAPIVAALGGAAGATQASPAEIEVILDLTEGRFADGARKARAIFAARPSQYEIGQQAAAALHELGSERQRAGDRAGALARFDETEALYHQVEAVARSDHQVLVDEAHFLLDVGDFHDQGPKPDTDGLYRHVLELCDQAARAAPELLQPDQVRAATWVRLGNLAQTRGDDPRPALRRTVELGRSLVARDASHWLGHLYLGEALSTLALEAARRGEDPSALYPEAVTELRAALERRDVTESAVRLGDTLTDFARFRLRGGEDPRAALEEAVAVSHAILARDGGNEEAHNNLACTLQDRATWELEHGVDPLPWLDEAEREFRRARELDASLGSTLTNLAGLLAVRARREAVLGGDPAALLAGAIETGARGEADGGELGSMRASMAGVYRIAAWNDARRGRDPRAALARAREEAAAAEKLDGGDPSARLERAMIEIFAARRANGGGVAAAALAQAEREVNALLKIDARDADALTLAGEVAELRAKNSSAACAQGRDALARAVARNPASARAWRTRARLESACARAERDPAHRAADEAAAAQAAARAKELDRFVEDDF